MQAHGSLKQTNQGGDLALGWRDADEDAVLGANAVDD
jgi:hypothetical protein